MPTQRSPFSIVRLIADVAVMAGLYGLFRTLPWPLGVFILSALFFVS